MESRDEGTTDPSVLFGSWLEEGDPPPRLPSPRDAGGVQKGDTLYENYITQAGWPRNASAILFFPAMEGRFFLFLFQFFPISFSLSLSLFLSACFRDAFRAIEGRKRLKATIYENRHLSEWSRSFGFIFEKRFGKLENF